MSEFKKALLQNNYFPSEESEKEMFERNINTYSEMQQYISKNVFGDRKADDKRLKLLRRNLSGWKGQLNVELSPVNPVIKYHIVANQDFNRLEREAALKLSTVIEQGLNDLQLRISDYNNKQSELDSIFENDQMFKLCLELFEDLGITMNGVCQLTTGKGGKLTGAIAAIQASSGILKSTVALKNEKLLPYFNNYLGTDFKTFDRRSNNFKEAQNDALKFIKLYHKK